MWKEGTVGVPDINGCMISCHWRIFLLEEASKGKGINGGKIEKMYIRVNGKTMASYDKGWERKPDEEDKAIVVTYSILLMEYN